MSFAIEVIADSTGNWCGNGIRLATMEEAEAYARDLASRWRLVTATRVVESPDPVGYEWTGQGVKPLVKPDTVS